MAKLSDTGSRPLPSTRRPKPDMGYAPELTGAAKAKQRVAEHGRDQDMHSMADSMHPVKR